MTLDGTPINPIINISFLMKWNGKSILLVLLHKCSQTALTSKFACMCSWPSSILYSTSLSPYLSKYRLHMTWLLSKLETKKCALQMQMHAWCNYCLRCKTISFQAAALVANLLRKETIIRWFQNYAPAMAVLITRAVT